MDETKDVASLEELTKAELLERAKAAGVTVPKRATKEDIIELLVPDGPLPVEVPEGVIPGETPGWPVDAETGEPLDLTPEQREELAAAALALEESETAEGDAGDA